MQLEQFRQIVERARDVILVTEAEPLDEPGPRIVYVNEAFTRLTGYTPEEVLGKSPRFLQHPPAADPNTLHQIRQGLESGQGFHGPILNFSKDGTPYWLDMHIFALRDEQGQVTHFAAIERDVTARTLREMELNSAAHTDPLTGLFNRRALTYMINAAWDAASGNSVLLLDLDFFKRINDGGGHSRGDEVLRALADVLLQSLGDKDYPVRMGGDEFAVVLIGAGVNDAEHRGIRIQQELAYTLARRDLPRCTVSVGVAGDCGSLQDTIDAADSALLQAKRSGRNQVLTA